MEVNTVNTASSFAQQQAYAGRSPTQSVEKPDRNDESNKVAQAREAQASRETERAQAQQQSEQTRQAEPPKPVVNAQGQKTGTIINTTA